jgi:hypothetical protein
VDITQSSGTLLAELILVSSAWLPFYLLVLGACGKLIRYVYKYVKKLSSAQDCRVI